MNNNYNKTYFEIYAVLTLLDIGYLEEFNVDIISDRPDIQFKDIGIEVTRDIPRQEAQQIGIFNKVLEKPKEEKKRILQKYDRNKISKLSEVNNYSVLELDCFDHEILTKAILGKNKKSNQYTKTEVLDLYVFTTTFMFDLETPETITLLLSDIKSNFDNIFIKSNDILFQYSNGQTIKHILNHKQLAYYKRKANKINHKYFDKFGNRLKK